MLPSSPAPPHPCTPAPLLPYALSAWISLDDPRYPPLVEEAVQETLVRVLARLDTFQGRSQFTTWVHSIF